MPRASAAFGHPGGLAWVMLALVPPQLLHSNFPQGLPELPVQRVQVSSVLLP